MKVFAVYDVKAKAYLQPFFMKTVGQAIRAFSEACRDQNTQFSRHPEDFFLMCLGDYDEVSGRFENALNPEQLATASEFMKAPSGPASVGGNAPVGVNSEARV